MQYCSLPAAKTDCKRKELYQTPEGQYNYLMLVDNQEKSEAIKALLIQNVDFGGITLTATIFGPTEDDVRPSEKPELELYEDAFTGNPLFEQTKVRSLAGISFEYCIFKKTVIQFWNDDLSDYYGNYNGLPTDIAKDVLRESTVQFSVSIN
ncbi:hypothetical protein [Murimonas intestini]|uniref:Uncharacterized protein n=1 Tax=Murimonas intestini TaxID=1337051 RepID=A0AB73T8A9_9FIRM|nr:hypothetical protein [Murimonas intestini]MCR1839689.1 hypothetical protein [Murimonas intestini]MCR1866532.1 hypothetical protein [Murimonas intestini]MCR1884844.1 hypothetical protein [Murimonas intestini]